MRAFTFIEAITIDRDLEKQQSVTSSVENSIHEYIPRPISKSASSWQFAWKDISYSADTKAGEKQILQKISGCVKSGNPLILCCRRFIGSLLAIMGPSGCGKTTLLNILSRRLTNSVTGTLLLDGTSLDDETLRGISTYVEQEDHLIGSLTVRETIDFAAKFALPGNIGAYERSVRTDEMLQNFGLVSVKNSKIGTPLQRGISGGQKRRVTTASQLITLPKIIFLGMEFQDLD